MAKKTSEQKTELHRMKDEEIELEVGRMRRRLFELRTQAVTEKIEDPSQFRKVRRSIARLLTERRARELAAASGTTTR